MAYLRLDELCPWSCYQSWEGDGLVKDKRQFCFCLTSTLKFTYKELTENLTLCLKKIIDDIGTEFEKDYILSTKGVHSWLLLLEAIEQFIKDVDEEFDNKSIVEVMKGIYDEEGVKRMKAIYNIE